MAYDDGGILHVGKTEIVFEQTIAVGDKLFLKGFDRPIAIYDKVYRGNMAHFYGQMLKR